MIEKNSDYRLSGRNHPDGLLTPDQCRQRAEYCEGLGMAELAAKWRRLAEQTEKVVTQLHAETTSRR
jgi:hypothetical protein